MGEAGEAEARSARRRAMAHVADVTEETRQWWHKEATS